MAQPLLEIDDLSVDFKSAGQVVHAVRQASLQIARGETLALVGESGSGKSVTAHSILRLLPYPKASHPSGRVAFDGRDVLSMNDREMRGLRGNRIGMIFQEPMTSLNPLHTVEKQINEMLFIHQGLRPGEATRRTIELLEAVGLPDAKERLASYPHQLSGGQRQRVMIAMALANHPDLLIADEPTTALDVTIQAQILELLADLKKRLSMAMLLITHDLGIVRHVADRVAVMYQGEIVETNDAPDLFERPAHAYTRTLLAAGPSARPAPVRSESATLLAADEVKVWFPIKRGVLRRTVDHFRAVDGVSFRLRAGSSLGIVGESGSGKTTLGLALLRLIASRGGITFDGTRLDGLSQKRMRPLRREMQIVFQDPFGSLSPRLPVGEIVGEGLKIHGVTDAAARDEVVVKALTEVGLEPETRHRYPHEFSGGQRQRLAIARALVLEPKLIILDEPTSSLDRTVQFQIVELLRGLQARHGLAYIFITHDLKLVRALCHDVLVLHGGKIEEQGPTEEVLAAPKRPYTQALLAAAFEQPGGRQISELVGG
jgi:microcin C transport system ATP-binding protein